jgi:GNAT superfamily N-acetyltransferase
MNRRLDPLFQTRDCHARRLGDADRIPLQTLLEQCADYFQLVCGTPPEPTAAQELFAQIPERKNYEDKFVIGCYSDSGRLIGVLDAIRDYPAVHEWEMGLFLLDPRQRNRGLGGQLYRGFERWVIPFGARYIRLGVVEQNEKAFRFWRRMGYEPMDKKPPQRFGMKENIIILMRRTLFE